MSTRVAILCPAPRPQEHTDACVAYEVKARQDSMNRGETPVLHTLDTVTKVAVYADRGVTEEMCSVIEDAVERGLWVVYRTTNGSELEEPLAGEIVRVWRDLPKGSEHSEYTVIPIARYADVLWGFDTVGPGTHLSVRTSNGEIKIRLDSNGDGTCFVPLAAMAWHPLDLHVPRGEPIPKRCLYGFYAWEAHYALSLPKEGTGLWVRQHGTDVLYIEGCVARVTPKRVASLTKSIFLDDDATAIIQRARAVPIPVHDERDKIDEVLRKYKMHKMTPR